MTFMTKSILFGAAGLIALLPAKAGAQQDSAAEAFCAAIDRPCIARGNVAVVEGEEGDEALLDAIPAAGGIFDRYFNADMPLSIVWRISGDPKQAMAAHEELEGAGYGEASALFWPSERAQMAMMRKGMMEQLRSQFPDRSEEELERMASETRVMFGRPGADGESQDEEAFGIERHEIGHDWIARRFPDPAVPEGAPHMSLAAGREDGVILSTQRYGSHLPDWVDEMGAVLMETAFQKEGRRNMVRQFGVDALIPLDTFLTMEHPRMEDLRAREEALVDGEQPKVGIVIMQREQTGKPDPTAFFYAQALMFAEYLVARSDDDRALIPLLTHINGGGSVADWLANQKEYLTLPTTMDALQVDWNRWVAEQFLASSD